MWSRTRRLGDLSRLALLLATLGSAVACGGGAGDGRQRAVGGALWVNPESDTLDLAGLARLGEVGIHELFVEAGRITGPAEAPRLERVALPALPTGASVTLVLRGPAPLPGTDFAAAAQALVAEIETLRREVEGRQLLPLGVHLELSGNTDADQDAAVGEALDALRELLDPGLFLSLGLDHAAIDRDSALEAADHADFVVAWLYGQVPTATDTAAVWDPDRTLAGLDRLERADLDHLLGLRTVPRIELRGRDGATRATTTRGSLRAFVNRPQLERQAGDLFAGAGRIVYSFRARNPAEVLGMSAASGDEIRVIRTAPGVVQDLINRVTTRNPRHYLGSVMERLAGPGESLAFSVDDIVTAFGNAPGGAKLMPRIVVKSRRSDTWVFEIVLANEGRQGTDLASTEWNFLQLRVEDAFISRVVPGSFSRYRFWLREQEVRPGIVGWREPDEVRLYTPLIEGGETLRAEIEVRARSSSPKLTLRGSFVLPEGRILELDPWNGSFLQVPSR